MAARTITMDELKSAVQEYASRHELTVSSNEKGFCLMPGDTVITLAEGKPRCSNAEILDSLIEILMDLAENAPKSSNLAVRGNGRITSRSQAGSVPGSALEAVRECQSTEKATYSPGGSRKAAAAKTNIAALMEAGGSLQIVGREHTPTYMEVVVRASIPDGKSNRVVESSMSIWKQEYLAKKAWDWIVKVLMEEPGIVTGTDEYGMPEFREGATIKVRISDDGKSMLVPLPAKIALWRELAREWQFAGRVCESKAYSRAADMLLRGDFQSREELSEEQAEVDAIAEKGA
jgi:hypothetical protein